MPKDVREETVKEFLNGTLDVLISTDLMSRGIDTSRVEHVIQLECPDDLPSYIHRCGRTARAGKGGVGKLLCFCSGRFVLFLVSVRPTHLQSRI